MNHTKTSDGALVDNALVEEAEYRLQNATEYNWTGGFERRFFIEFFRTALSRARADERRKIAAWAEREKKDMPSEADDSVYRVYVDGYNNAVHDVCLHLTTLNEQTK